VVILLERRRHERTYFSARMYATKILMSASDTVAFGGIGTGPQTPEPPLFIFSASFAAAPASPRYFAAPSLYDGPTTFLSTAWQAVQPSFFISSSPESAARAAPVASTPATRITAAIFIVTPSGEWGKTHRMVLEATADRHSRAPLLAGANRRSRGGI